MPGVPSQWTTVVRISAGFFFLFMAFNTVANLVSTLVSDQRLVQTANALLYAVFTASTIIAPAVIARVGARAAMCAGAVPYVLLVFANLQPSWALFIPAYAGVGVGAAMIWTAQGIELSRAAVVEARRTGGSVEAINSRFTGFFWSTFQFNGAVGLLIASTIFVLAPDYKASRRARRGAQRRALARALADNRCPAPPPLLPSPPAAPRSPP